ncbi:N-acetyltransferase [Rhizobium sp. TRM95111]|uniref:GNAT family N-acetyltransferase n=1 Tax=Rhizobium alarense TaxID=2846851 RepID=UPI001F1CAC53|nr:N-acetyltransferase [Rhizobium alarense]MCF3638646.1 N-acetyltransferase [Rhizobium alarense]
MILRDEGAGDVDAIRALTARAFAGMPYSDGSEPAIVDRLRAAGALTLSLVAEEAGLVVGHVAFSPVTVTDGSTGWYGLGPISVAPERQGQGIGSALVREGFARLKALGAAGCVLVGDPGYYGRFGLSTGPALTYDGAPPEYFMHVAFSQVYATGGVSYHPAFYG